MRRNYKSLGAYSEAEKYYKRAFEILPNRLYPLSLLMEMYVEIQDWDKAKKIAEKITNTKLKISSSATDDIKARAEELMGIINLKKEMSMK